MLVVLFAYSLISMDAVLWLLPLLAFYVAYAAMLIATMQMFHARRKLNDISALGEMLERFNDQFERVSAESAYSWSSLSPYVTFFLALPAMVLSFTAADKTWIMCSELALLSLIITVACFLALSDSYDYLAVCSILLDNISTLPVFIEGLPRIPFVYPALQLVVGAGISFQLLPQFYVQFGIPSLAYVIVPLLFLRMAMLKSWHGTYQVLVPHLVCFFWWRVVVTFYLHSTWIGLLRASVGWILLALLLPVLTLGLFVWIIYYLFRAFSISTLVKIATTATLIAAISAFAVWARGGFRIGGKFNLEDQKSKKVNILLSVIVLISSVPLVYIVAPEDMERKSVYLDWETFHAHCDPTNWHDANKALSCVHFTDAKVRLFYF